MNVAKKVLAADNMQSNADEAQYLAQEDLRILGKLIGSNALRWSIGRFMASRCCVS